MSKETNFDNSFYNEDEYDEYEYDEYDVHPTKTRSSGGGSGSKNSVYSSKCVRAKEAMMEKAKTNGTIKGSVSNQKKGSKK